MTIRRNPQRMTGIDAVCFDLDGTLCIRDQDLKDIIEAVFERVDADPFYTPADIRDVDPAALPPANSYREFYENSIRAIAENVGEDSDRAPILAEATVEVADETVVSFRSGARDALVYACKHYSVGLISNGSEDTQMTKLARLGIRDAFDLTVFCHSKLNVPAKPDPEPFELALIGLDSRPETTVFVGDSYTEDIVGAHDAGMRTVWVPNGDDDLTGEDVEPDHVLDSLAGLPELLAN